MQKTNFQSVSLFSVLLLAIFFTIGTLISYRNATLFLVGAGLGSALFLGTVGFTSTWRNLICHKKAPSMLNQFFLIAATTIFCLPIIVNTDSIQLTSYPLNLTVILGAFMFGLGMQLGNGCGSGTLVSSASGSAHSLITLIFFILGAGIASLLYNPEVATSWLSSSSLQTNYGLLPTIIIQCSILFALAIAVAIYVKTKNLKEILAILPTKKLFFASLIIASLVAIALLISGKMWNITYGISLWGAKLLLAIGIPVNDFDYWQVFEHNYALSHPVLADSSSVLNLGVILGVSFITLIKAVFPKTLNVSAKQIIAAILGGLLMGIGSWLSFGCNIGAYLSSIASGSLHGWLWLATAFIGTILGVKLRPSFGLSN